MEILRRGNLPSEDTFDGKCIHCRTVVRFKRSEGKSSPDPRDMVFIGVDCPVCNRLIEVSLSQKNKKMLGLSDGYFDK